MWQFFHNHQSVDAILRDKGLAKVGDGLVNLCYSLAKSQVLGKATGEKVRDRVLANAIRETSIGKLFRRRTDPGTAADGYEAILAYLWLNNHVTIESAVALLVENLEKESLSSIKDEKKTATLAFQILLQHLIELLPLERD
ncbi:MAG: ribonuclease III family protein [Candidatus Hodarchaeota archaeon]